MPTATYDGHDVAVNDEGFLTDPGQWTEEMARGDRRGPLASVS